MNLYFMSVMVGANRDLACACHIAAATPSNAREIMEARFLAQVPTEVIQQAPDMARIVIAFQDRARAEGFEVTARKSNAPMSQAVNA